MPFEELIQIDKNSNAPKYLQIVTSGIEAVASGKLTRGVQLPSINELANRHKTAKDTVVKDYVRKGIYKSLFENNFFT